MKLNKKNTKKNLSRKRERDESKSESNTMSGLPALPEGCIAAIISVTSPRDACASACVSTTFRSAAESDFVWDRFLPHEYLTAISASSSTASSKKELYLQACHKPVLIHEGKLSFWLDKPSGKKCYMISARELSIVWGDDPQYWGWIQLPEARFPKVSELRRVRWFDIGGEINTSLLSPRTTYIAYLVFKPLEEPYGFENNPVEVTVRLDGGKCQKRTVCLDTREERNIVPWHLKRSLPRGSFPEKRGDGWFESELGGCFCEGNEDSALSMTIKETKRGNWKRGLVFQGIEIRPKKGVNK